MPDEPRELGLDSLTGLLAMGPDMMIQILGTVIDAIGTGTQFSGEQIAKLGELAGVLADKVKALSGGNDDAKA